MRVDALIEVGDLDGVAAWSRFLNLSLRLQFGICKLTIQREAAAVVHLL